MQEIKAILKNAAKDNEGNIFNCVNQSDNPEDDGDEIGEKGHSSRSKTKANLMAAYRLTGEAKV